MKPEEHWDLLAKQDHTLVSKKQRGPVRVRPTCYGKDKHWSCQQHTGRDDQMHTSCSNTGHAAVRNKQNGLVTCWLTTCLKPRASSCQQQPGTDSHMLTYKLSKTQSMLLSVTTRKSQPHADLQPVQNTEHALVSRKRKGLAICWLTSCPKPRACFCQQQAGRAGKMLTYNLSKTQSMVMSATSRRGQPDADSQPVETHSMLLSAPSRKGQPDADLHSIQNPDEGLISNKKEEPRVKLTACSKPRACTCQQQARRASQMLSHILFKMQSTLLSAIRRKGQLDADLQPVQNPDHALISNKQ